MIIIKNYLTYNTEIVCLLIYKYMCPLYIRLFQEIEKQVVNNSMSFY